MSLVQLLFGFEGRIRRLTWWLAHLGVVGAMLVGWMIVAGIVGVTAATSGFTAASVGSSLDGAKVGMITVMALAAVATVGLELWIGIALAVKRCHDRNYPGAMAMLMFIPGVGALWALVDLGFIDGTPGRNRFGPSPKTIDPMTARSYAI